MMTPEMVNIEVVDRLIEGHSKKDETVYPINSPSRTDIDGDGVDDLNNGFTVSVSKTGQEYQFSPSGPTSAGFDDIDGDGKVDAWCCDPEDVCVRVIWGTGPGEFGKRQGLGPFPVLSKGAFFDVDKDGDLDFVVKTDSEVASDTIVPITPEYRWIELQRK